jgi:hypothetical protein
MSKDLQIGSNIYEYPSPGEPAGWSEGASDWAEGVTNALATVQGPNDILLTSSSLVIPDGTPETEGPFNVNGFLFDSATVQGFEAQFLVTRTYTDATPKEVESGDIMGNGTGAGGDFFISVSSIGDTGISFSITSDGQVQYTMEERANTQNIQIKFKAKTIDQLGNG